ncbi:hypothetical protein [Agathobaculum desmolans]|uniref:hypothetical protein n=1 Tax=Agathobaculum desmolans TaxID=39484 RepID=UPI00248E4B18|nr:hypothetical protein [Agathobaculum desmolans]
MVEYLLDQLLELFNADLSYFAERVPVIDDIANIFIAVGWALLIGNLAYQAMRAMASGVGVEAEEPGRLFLRTAMFSFLLLASRQICDIGFGLSASVMEMLQAPDAITFEPFGEETFDTLPNAGWLIVIVVNVVIQWQLIRLFFEVAERYVILCVLTYCAPLAFAMGGSKSTSDIFRGWLRMFASMCVLMVFNLVFVKLVLSALSTDPNSAAIIPWAMLVVGIVRMAKKMDGIILRIGMNPALTGDPLGTRFPGAATVMALRSIAAVVTRTAAKNAPSAGHSNMSGPPPQGDSILHGGIAGGTSGSAPGANGQHMASAEKNTRRSAALHSAATQRADAGARTASAMAAFRSRYGADHAQTMRQVRQAIHIDADDWEEDSYTGSNVVQNGAARTIAETGSRVMPPAPPMRPLPTDFGRMSPPETDGKLPPVMPPRVAEEPVSHTVSPVMPPMHMQRPPEQALHDLSGRTPAQEHNDYKKTVPGHGTAQADRDRQSGKISPVMPPSPRQIRPNRTGEKTHTSISNTGQPAASPVSRVTPSRPSVPAGSPSQMKQDTVPVTGTSAVTAASGVVPGHADQAHISPSRDAPPRAAQPATGSTVSPARPQISSAAQRGTPSPASTTPPAWHKPSAQAGVQVTPVQAASVMPAAPPQTHAQPSAEMQPNITPADRRPAVAPARRERKTEYRDAGSRPDISPGVRTPDMVTPPPTGQPRALHRSAQPLKNKVMPEAPKRGGTRNRKRKRKK